MAVIFVNSCASTKSITYLADLQNDSLQVNSPTAPPDNLLKIGSNLYVNIQTTSEETNKLFNPTSSSQSGSSQLFESPSSQYIYGYTIDKEGAITLPVLGKIELAGLSQNEAQSKVQLLANKYLKEATVKLKLLNFKITLMGEVKAPGVYYNYNDDMTVFEAASMAGGFTDMAQLDQVLVMRKTKEGTKSYRLDMTNKSVLYHKAYYLQPNDVVYAQPTNVKTLNLNLPIISLIFSTISFLLVALQL